MLNHIVLNIHQSWLSVHLCCYKWLLTTVKEETKQTKIYPGSSKQDILSLGNNFPLDVCLFLAFSSPPLKK